MLSSGVGSSGGATLWQSGFLPSTHAGVLFREQGEPVLNLANPDGLPPELQRASLDTLRDANQQRLELMRDPEIASRIASYELAYRMQSSAPELIDFSSESKATLEAYGVERDDPPNGGRGKSGNTAQSFVRNCLLARRMVERPNCAAGRTRAHLPTCELQPPVRSAASSTCTRQSRSNVTRSS